MKSIINILCATDSNYAALCGIMLTSLFENNKNSTFNIYILTDGITNEDQKKLERLTSSNNADLSIIKLNASDFSNCPIWPGDHLSTAAYYRLMVSELLPKSINKVLYIDCDIIVNDSIQALWEQNIEDVAIGAVLDAEFFNSEFYQRLQIKNKNQYFNSGVLLINLEYWRRKNVVKRCFECIEKNKHLLRFHDQDTLNMVLQEEVTILPIKYNLQTPFLMTCFSSNYINIMPEIKQAIQRPCIIHYIGSGKPWNGKISNHPFKSYFHHYKNLSAWKNVDISKTKAPISSLMIWYINNILWFLKLKKEPNIYIIHRKRI